VTDTTYQYNGVAVVSPGGRRIRTPARFDAVIGDDRPGEGTERDERMAWVRAPDDTRDMPEALDDGAHLSRRRDLRVEGRRLGTNLRPPGLRYGRVLPEARFPQVTRLGGHHQRSLHADEHTHP